MDYSSTIHDPENPAGASPWGSSPAASPQHPRTSAFPARDTPPSPTLYSPNPIGNAGFSHEDIMGGGGYNRPESSAGISVSDSDGRRPDTAESVRSEAESDPQQPYLGQQQRQTPSQPYQTENHRPEPQRYHPAVRQAQQNPGPQYKLQAKITGLERTGRKDPILRFDVHVSCRFELTSYH